LEIIYSSLCAHSQVGRWSALGLGVLYGFTHNRSLHKLEAENKIKHEYERKERLIEQARAEYAKLHAKPDDGAGNAIFLRLTFGTWVQKWMIDSETFSVLVVTDVDSPNFDLEKFIAHLESQDKQ
jgi:F-type H+-transporting ATP synthase subunit e